MNQKEYEEDLHRRQQEHLSKINGPGKEPFIPCAHDGCPECIGTGKKKDGSTCIHLISCACPKCHPGYY
jgi:hypothetical protein